jgi:hypothetical protein
MDAVRAVFGDDYEVAYVPDGARKLLSPVDERGVQHETVLEWRP